jgi:hypothetical protein
MKQLEQVDSTLSWEVQGADVEPSQVDVLSTLGAATAYLELLQSVAELRREKLHFTSMRIEKGILAIELQVDEPAVARAASRDAQEYLDGRRLAPQGIKHRIHEVHRALGRLPVSQTVRVSVADFEAEVARQGKEPHLPPTEILELRVAVIRVGGHPARIVVINDVEGAFSLALSQEQAAAIAHRLYREVDVSAEVSRDEDGKIVDGTVLEFFELEDAEGQAEADTWRQWFSAAGAGWDDVDDIEAELDRSHGVGSP